jgi:hypothetical protein
MGYGVGTLEMKVIGFPGLYIYCLDAWEPRQGKARQGEARYGLGESALLSWIWMKRSSVRAGMEGDAASGDVVVYMTDGWVAKRKVGQVVRSQQKWQWNINSKATHAAVNVDIAQARQFSAIIQYACFGSLVW